MVWSTVCSCSVSLCCAEKVVLKSSRASWDVGGGVCSRVKFDSTEGRVSDPGNVSLRVGLVTSAEFALEVGDCASCGDVLLVGGV